MHDDLSIKRVLARLETLEAEVAALRRENQQLRQENQQLRRDNQHLRQANEQLRRDNQQLHQDNQQLRDEIARLKKNSSNSSKPHSAFSRPRFPLPFWQSGGDGRMEQGRWEGPKHARRCIIASACVGGKKGVKKRQFGPNSDKKVKKSRKKRSIRPCPS